MFVIELLSPSTCTDLTSDGGYMNYSYETYDFGTYDNYCSTLYKEEDGLSYHEPDLRYNSCSPCSYSDGDNSRHSDSLWSYQQQQQQG